MFEVARQDLLHNLRRPLFWMQILILGLFIAELSGGHASIGSGDARVGGTKAWINSEFANAQFIVLLFAAMYVFFISVAAGMSLIRDDELKVGEVLHSTRLTPGEYVWGKFLAVTLSFAGVLAAQVLLQLFFFHVMPHGSNAEYIGPLSWSAYLRPMLIFGLPALLLFCGACFAVGGLTRQPVLVFALPIAVLVLGISFLWDWSPAWLSPAVNRALQFADLTGYRWLKENYLAVDRGVAFYNHARIGLDGLILGQRLLAGLLGLGCVALVQARFAARLRGARVRPRDAARAVASPAVAPERMEPAFLSELRMRSGAPGLIAGTLQVAVTELKLLGRHPGLYLFVPLILIQIFGGLVSTGAFDTPLLYTSGTLASNNMNTLTLLICMLILFYTAESLQREAGTGFGAIANSTPVATASLLSGKALANAVLGAAIVVAALVGCAIVLAIQGHASFSIGPFVIMWGLLLMPTFLLWTAFISAVFAISNSRYATYALGLGAMSVTGWLQMRNKMNWVGNWDLWSATRWTDIATFQLDRTPLLLNRIFALGMTALLVTITVRAFARRERDATRNLQRLAPASLGRGALSLAPWLAVPLIAGVALALQVTNGWEGAAAKKKAHDYWAKNTLTYRDVALPSITHTDADVVIDPAHHKVRSRGTYELTNRTAQSLTTIPLSSGLNWRETGWTLNGVKASPENRAGLNVFHLDEPLAPGEHVDIGWSFSAEEPAGTSKNGSGMMEFALPSSIVLTSFSSANLGPYLGFETETGVEDDKNKADPREYPDDYWKGETPAGIPMAESWFDTHLRVTVPKDLEVNATGVCVSDVVRGAERVTEWKSDHPVRIWNVVAGDWKVKRGDGVAIYYDAHHPWNVDEMYEALAGARRWYGEWFAPFPWGELRLSEFAGLSSYAMGSPGNITFSESIGFLTQSKPEANAAFWITAHEAAHQWWPNIAMTGRGPGGDVLSEGMAHFSTILLTEQVKGLEQRMSFCQEIENRYSHTRRGDSERPLVKVNGELPGDGRIIYDKGGWALWMLYQLMGRENSLAAQREYLEAYRDARDHPLLQDYLAVMRRHAPDTTAFDAYVKQWFYAVVTPQYQILDPEVKRAGSGWTVHATIKNVGTGVMPIEVAAARGERFPHGKTKSEAYRDARTTVTLAAGAQQSVEIPCAFAPERVLVDPDVRVLMLERKKANVPVHAPGSEAGAVAGLSR
jgi:ABC-type Na+ efflux pump permease subunit